MNGVAGWGGLVGVVCVSVRFRKGVARRGGKRKEREKPNGGRWKSRSHPSSKRLVVTVHYRAKCNPAAKVRRAFRQSSDLLFLLYRFPPEFIKLISTPIRANTQPR